MKNKVVVDTNLFLDDEKILYKLAKEYKRIIIPLTVLKELDQHKYKRDTSYSARKAILAIRDFRDEKPESIKFRHDYKELTDNDMKIIDAAMNEQATIATKDISMSIIAEANGLDTRLYDVILNNIFDPYIYLESEILIEGNNVFTFQQYYEGKDYHKTINIISNKIKQELLTETWFFLIINCDDGICVYANNPITYRLERIDNRPQYRELKIKENTIKAQDEYQNCALYSLKNAPNTLLTGRWGSGKSLIGTAFAVENTFRKVFITRPPVGINKKYDLGFMPGAKEDKMLEWVSGIMSALYFIFANTRSQKGSGVTYDHVRDQMFGDLFEPIPVNSIQGMSLLRGDIMVVDEVQLLDVDTLSMILSRPSKGGKLILLGDLKQTYNVVKPSESGLLKLLRALPHKSLSYVKLQNSYRSDLLEIADMLQDKSTY